MRANELRDVTAFLSLEIIPADDGVNGEDTMAGEVENSSVLKLRGSSGVVEMTLIKVVGYEEVEDIAVFGSENQF